MSHRLTHRTSRWRRILRKLAGFVASAARGGQPDHFSAAMERLAAGGAR